METGLRQRRLAALQENDLAKSYGQLQAQIQKLQAEAEALKAKEIEGVIARIRTAIEHYGITPDQLFGKAKKASTSRAARNTCRCCDAFATERAACWASASTVRGP